MNKNDYVDIDYVCPKCLLRENIHPAYHDFPGDCTLECLCGWDGTVRGLKKKITRYKVPAIDSVEYV